MTRYDKIVGLRNNLNNADRGYKFEQAIRDILPWDVKPPVSVKGDSEQLDGVFLWKNQAYLVESKAKKEKITVGSHDWEDFELKIRRRRSTVVGLFCSLYPVHKNVFKKASELTKEGHLIIILEGNFWDELTISNLDIADVLDYMNIYGRTKFIASPPQLRIIKEWIFDKDEIIYGISKICKDHSSILLGRHKSKYHDKLYIERDVERQINSYVKELKPNVLIKKEQKSNTQIEEKEVPKQICLLRDFSGSGKTTTSVQISLANDLFLGVGMTANEQSIDQKCFLFFESLGNDYGIRKLKEINKPIIYIIDSLDEASNIPGKKNEILAILRKINELNKKAEEYGLHAYPILFVFTIREDYWRDWESLFEGSNRFDINKRISCFTDIEFPMALQKYMTCYDFEIINELTDETTEVLSRPINLLIFSETHQSEGKIEVSEIWESSVIYNYFERKMDNISRRPFPGFQAQALMNLLSEITYAVINSKHTIVDNRLIIEIIQKDYLLYFPFYDEIIKVLISEHILVEDFDNECCFRFRHSRFLEFLMAYYCLNKIKSNNLVPCISVNYDPQQNIGRQAFTHKMLHLTKNILFSHAYNKQITNCLQNNKDDSISLLDKIIETSFNSGIVAMFRIYDDMRYICMHKYPELLAELDNYYSKSNIFMSHKISSLRYGLANNIKVSDNDITLILKNVNSGNPKLSIETFHVIASKPCKQPSKIIIDIFVLAFRSMYNVSEQYKMIQKLISNDLLCNEQVLLCILQSDYPRNWETYLGGIIVNMKEIYDEFKDLWVQTNGEKRLEHCMRQSQAEDWSQVKKLLQVILSGEDYIVGDF